MSTVSAMQHANAASPIQKVTPHLTANARLIPGMAVSGGLSIGARKKPQAARSDWRLPAEAAPERVEVDHRGALHSLAQVLPRPQDLSSQSNLAVWVVSDIAIVLATAGLALAFLRPVLYTWSGAASLEPVARALGYVFLQAVLITLIGYSEGAYRTDRPAGRLGIPLPLAKSVVWSTLLVALSAGRHSLLLLSLSGALGLSGMLLARFCRRPGFEARSSSTASRNVLIVGANKEARSLASYLDSNPHMRRTVVGFIDDYWPVGDDVLGRITDLDRLSRAHFVDEVMVALDDPRAVRAAVQTAVACQLDVELVPNLAGCANIGYITQIGRWPLVSLHQERPPELALFIKRAVDLVASIAGLLLTSPLFAIVALCIRLDSTGPIIYSAPRVGRKGTRFPCYKFRSMSADADAQKQKLRSQNQREGPFFKIARDPRITRCGRWLRKYSLDELPQLWNVLRGDMSLVGPRPHPLDDFAGYQLADLCRLDVRPGMTGLWQTTARRDPSFHTSMKLDKEYIERWSLALDFQILVRTLGVVVAGGGC
jgi:exopolysaccharide biosynthesis polyprenyl glycosylphosphotransferase